MYGCTPTYLFITLSPTLVLTPTEMRYRTWTATQVASHLLGVIGWNRPFPHLCDSLDPAAFSKAQQSPLPGTESANSDIAPSFSVRNVYDSVQFFLQRRGNDTVRKKKAPFFELDVQLSVPSVRLSPTLEDVQGSVNTAAASVLGCAKRLYDWGEAGVAEADRFSFFEALGSDLEIIKTVLLLTGASYGTAVQASFCILVGRRNVNAIKHKRHLTFCYLLEARVRGTTTKLTSCHTL